MIRFHARAFPYLMLLLRTFFLSGLTFGLYSFWGRTRQREYLWSSTEVLGEPLEYTGTGKELFLGFLLAVPILLLLTVLSAAARVYGHPVAWLLLLPVPVLLLNFAIYRTLRYRLTRTRWRGIRGNLGGSAVSYAFKATGYMFLTACSLGLLYPWASGKVAGMVLNNVWFGNRRLEFSGSARRLFGPFLLTLLWCGLVILGALLLLGGHWYTHERPLLGAGIALTVLALLVGTAFYRAAFFRWLLAHAAFGRMDFRSSLSGGQLLRLTLSNGLFLVLTLGLGTGVVIIRTARARLHSILSRGEPDLDTLLQDTRTAPKTGEGLLGDMDVDIGF